ncbi:hypothetical protein ACIBL8_48585 [Streptomyces sp. NPDC050523]|uniref:hypothetical protein n=1 Tax=Streptomyces sp. NPDC050523 TaxID=3365622 RepID=UPI00379CAAB4
MRSLKAPFNPIGDIPMSGDTYNASNNTSAQQGPQNSQTNYVTAEPEAVQARDIAAAIVALIRAETDHGRLTGGPGVLEHAEALRSEMETAVQVQQPPDEERFRQASTRLIAALGTGAAISGSVTAMVESIRLIFWP